MMIIKISEFGTILTGREFGENVYRELSNKISSVVELDFDGVISLGSSFGDEVVPPIAKKQGGIIKIKNTNNAVKRALENVASDAKITIKFE